MKILHFFYLLLLLNSLSCKKITHHDEHRGRGKYGCIPTAKIVLNNNKFEEFESRGKYFIKFLGGTIHIHDYAGNSTGNTYEEDILFFRSNDSSVDIWNAAISDIDPAELNKLEVGIESPLITPFAAKYYFEKVSIWVDKKRVYTNVEE